MGTRAQRDGCIAMQWIVSLLSGPILNTLLDGYRARLASNNTTEHAAVDLAKDEIKAEMEARKSAEAIILAEQGTWFTRIPRAMVQYSFAIFIAKVVVWDKVLGWGTTDPLAGDVATYATMLMGMWFGGRTIEKVAQIFKR